MSSTAQVLANRENASHSSGPTSQAGKAISSSNRRLHGLIGRFILLSSENPSDFNELIASLQAQHQPATDTETRLVEAIAQHYWLMQRAINLQNSLLTESQLDHRAFSLYLRYQTSNERAYYKAMSELRTLRKEKRLQEIGFESQKRKHEEDIRKQELNQARVRLANSRAASSELDTEIRGTMEAPIPGNARIAFDDMANAFRVVLRDLNKNFAAELAKDSAA